METFNLWVNLVLVFSLSEVGHSLLGPSGFFPREQQHAAARRPQIPERSEPMAQKSPLEAPQRVRTVSVSCYPDSLEITIQADMFGIGIPVNSGDVRLGVEQNGYCTAVASSGDEYRILVGLTECGTRHWMTEDSLVYTNLLIYSPETSPDGLIRMEEAVIPIECHYERKYSLSSSSLTPTWIPYMSTQAALETLQFGLKIMTSDWMYERPSNVFHLGEPINIEASVGVGHHTGLRVFVSSCVATVHPDMDSVPRYVFVENGCLLDSTLPGSKSHFLPRTEAHKLNLVIDAFRFHNDDRGELYVTCTLNAVPVENVEALNKACTLISDRWRSADGNDYLCGQCQNLNEVGQTHSKASSPSASHFLVGPSGTILPRTGQNFWRSKEPSAKVWEQEAKLGPMVVLPSEQKSGPLPEQKFFPRLFKIGSPALYSSKWRSWGTDSVDVLPDSSTEEEEDQTDSDLKSGTHQKDDDDDEDGDVAAPVEKLHPALTLSKSAAININDTATPSAVSPTAILDTEETTATTTQSQPIDPKK